MDEPLNDAVVAELTEHREFHVGQAVDHFPFTHLPREPAANQSALPSFARRQGLREEGQRIEIEFHVSPIPAAYTRRGRIREH
ncbi:hypothetical protein NJB14197_33640 [Mycobacterium montefiorense]|uniref:Uncharacterized protein n=1 Tax=Mycobacterium montefiorense TaxID=154654 RepID=A0AA37PIY8_9MYCO|nr:hypothetical protein MmonteBS_28650 [Mycobacterium montefiorense]GKU34321.1 hypothetical protein NJB14191_16670 [Mycobacterium montefiorense]GKU38942.1 hypothetical protein NJB14192_09380 [Mycobacterium montefiorense]GKU48023.1 hypothetical protein NJB14194_46390 [Mycobacterium montefiorense]GKU49706.1 hypothetical protein NJB14195_09520 [Mycobacterium montefiorense]